MEYKELTQKEGQKYMSKIWTIFLSKEDDLFVNPFSNRQIRYRCIFLEDKNLIYVYLNIDEINYFKDLNPTPEEIYLYGAYNQVDVCQMRAYGTIHTVEKGNMFNFIIYLMKKRLSGTKIYIDNFSEGLIYPYEEERKIAITSLASTGKLYCFSPLSYACNVYKR